MKFRRWRSVSEDSTSPLARGRKTSAASNEGSAALSPGNSNTTPPKRQKHSTAQPCQGKHRTDERDLSPIGDICPCISQKYSLIHTCERSLVQFLPNLSIGEMGLKPAAMFLLVPSIAQPHCPSGTPPGVEGHARGWPASGKRKATHSILEAVSIRLCRIQPNAKSWLPPRSSD